jgi:hypothetical protein
MKTLSSPIPVLQSFSREAMVSEMIFFRVATTLSPSTALASNDGAFNTPLRSLSMVSMSSTSTPCLARSRLLYWMTRGISKMFLL